MDAQLSVSELISKAALLEKSDFEQLFNKLSLLRVERKGVPVLNGEESELIHQINMEFNQVKWERLKYLDWKMESASLSSDEDVELLHLAEEYESYSVKRLSLLSRLAAIRNISLLELMDQLGLKPAENG